MLNVIEYKTKFGYRYMSQYKAVTDYGSFIKAGAWVSYQDLRASMLTEYNLHVVLVIEE